MKENDKNPKSKILAAAYKTAADLHNAGVIDAEKMRKYDLLTSKKPKKNKSS